MVHHLPSESNLVPHRWEHDKTRGVPSSTIVPHATYRDVYRKVFLPKSPVPNTSVPTRGVRQRLPVFLGPIQDLGGVRLKEPHLSSD